MYIMYIISEKQRVHLTSSFILRILIYLCDFASHELTVNYLPHLYHPSLFINQFSSINIQLTSTAFYICT